MLEIGIEMYEMWLGLRLDTFMKDVIEYGIFNLGLVK